MKVFNIIYNVVAITIILVFLFTAGVMVSGTKVFAVATPSMETEIPEGSLVFVRKADEYREGDVITAKLFGDKDNTFTHRIVSVDADKGLVYTKGDNNLAPDRLPTDTSDIIGKVAFSVPCLGLLALNFNSNAVVLVLAAVLVVLMLIRFIVYKKSEKEEVTENEKAQ